jgi:CBS domain-containing protein
MSEPTPTDTTAAGSTATDTPATTGGTAETATANGALAASAATAHAAEGSYLVPRFEHARVADAMRHGILSCAPDAPLREVARTMALNHVHTIVLTSPDDGGLLGIIAAHELLMALLDAAGAEPTAAAVAERSVETISSDETLVNAAASMRRRGVGHLVVVDAHSGSPTGMLSALDIAGILAWGEA